MSIEAMKQARKALRDLTTIRKDCDCSICHADELLRLAIREAGKREWVGLMDEEIETIVNNNTYDDSGYDIWRHGKGIARDIEAKLKEKNGG